MNNTRTEVPKRWKMMLLTWLSIYPLLNIIHPLLMPHINHLHSLLKTLIMTMVLVPAMSVLLGGLQSKYYDWLRR